MTYSACLLALAGIVYSISVRVGGDKMDGVIGGRRRGGGYQGCPGVLFPWLIIIWRCWQGVLRVSSQIAYSRRGIGMPAIWGKLPFRPNLCYSVNCDKYWLREKDRLEDFTRAKRFQNLFGTELSIGCGLILDFARHGPLPD